VLPTVCVRCSEPLVDGKRPCEFCRGEKREEAVRTLLSAAKSSSNASLAARADAIDTLRNLGHSPSQVLRARAHALDGHSVETVLGVLLDKDQAVAA
jgi:hypothetical protein